MSCKFDILFDKHHIVPVYAGGKNIANNIVKISRTSHAMFHFCNWQRNKNINDYVAWKGLVGQLSKQEIIKILSKQNGKQAYINRTGMFAISKEKRKIFSAKGGKKAGLYMSKSMWINNGIINKRILKSSPIPSGFLKGKVKKKKKKIKQKSKYFECLNLLFLSRKNDVLEIDLNKRGSIAYLSKKWNISHTQVRRYIKKHFL